MTFVLDASITLAWCFDDEENEVADSVFSLLDDENAIAPSVWPLELANSLLTAERRGRISPSETARIIGLVERLPVSVLHTEVNETMSEVIRIGRDQRLSAYDASYVYVALASGLSLATLDSRLRLVCQRVNVALIS